MDELKGLITALITPFNEEGVDFDGLRNNIEYQLQNGVNGILVLGSTGESPTLTSTEKKEVIKVAVATVNKRVPVIVGTGTNCTKTTYELTEDAKNLGADCALVVVPYYNRPSQMGLYKHFHALHSNTEFPLCIYNVPKRTGVNLEINTILDLAKLPRIIAIKDCTGHTKQITEIQNQLNKTNDSLIILSGDDDLACEMIKNGAQGLFSVASNIIPKTMSQLIWSALNHETETIASLQSQLTPLFHALNIENNPIPIKTAMNLWNFPAGPCRLPLCEMSPENLTLLNQTLKTYSKPSIGK